MSTAQDRVQIVESAPIHPGACVICATVGGDGRQFIDFGMSVRRYGHIYFCSTCWEEGCSNLGWTSPSNFATASLELLVLQEENTRLKEENAKLSTLISSSIPQLIGDLSTLQSNAQAPKRAVGRPKKAESGTPQ